MDAAKRLENLKKLEQIKQHLLELEKQVRICFKFSLFNFDWLFGYKTCYFYKFLHHTSYLFPSN